MPATKETLFETLHIDHEGIDRVVEKIKELIREGNVRRLLSVVNLQRLPSPIFARALTH